MKASSAIDTGYVRFGSMFPGVTKAPPPAAAAARVTHPIGMHLPIPTTGKEGRNKGVSHIIQRQLCAPTLNGGAPLTIAIVALKERWWPHANVQQKVFCRRVWRLINFFC